MERKELIGYIKEYASSSDFEGQSEIWRIINSRRNELFDHYAVKYIFQRMLHFGQDAIIGTVERHGHVSEPEDVFLMIDKFVELDQKLMSGELNYIWHIESMHFEEGGGLIQAYFCTPDIFKEFDKAAEKAAEEECELNRWVCPEMQVLPAFLNKYQKDQRLIEVWCGPY